MQGSFRVIAIGSPHGDDRAAWCLAERLRSRQEIDTDVVALSDPLELHDHFHGCERLIVVDACAGGGSPGTITRLPWPDARIEERHSHSTHGIGVAGALQLAETLDLLPPEVILYGIQQSQCQPGDSISLVVERALRELEEMILLEMQ